MFVLLFITSVILLPVITSRTHGVTFGGEVMGIRIVNRQNRIVNGFQLILRQAIGMGIPLMLFGYLFKTWGILGWWLINGIASLISPNQQTIMDIVLGLHLVYESETHIRFEPESQEKNEEEINTSKPVKLEKEDNTIEKITEKVMNQKQMSMPVTEEELIEAEGDDPESPAGEVGLHPGLPGPDLLLRHGKRFDRSLLTAPKSACRGRRFFVIKSPLKWAP